MKIDRDRIGYGIAVIAVVWELLWAVVVFMMLVLGCSLEAIPTTQWVGAMGLGLLMVALGRFISS